MVFRYMAFARKGRYPACGTEFFFYYISISLSQICFWSEVCLYLLLVDLEDY